MKYHRIVNSSKKKKKGGKDLYFNQFVKEELKTYVKSIIVNPFRRRFKFVI